MGFELKARRAVYVDITEELKKGDPPVSPDQVRHLETFDLIYRSLVALMYNYVPLSGHPGGSISSGRFVARLLFDTLSYDFSHPDRDAALQKIPRETARWPSHVRDAVRKTCHGRFRCRCLRVARARVRRRRLL